MCADVDAAALLQCDVDEVVLFEMIICIKSNAKLQITATLKII